MDNFHRAGIIHSRFDPKGFDIGKAIHIDCFEVGNIPLDAKISEGVTSSVKSQDPRGHGPECFTQIVEPELQFW